MSDRLIVKNLKPTRETAGTIQCLLEEDYGRVLPANKMDRVRGTAETRLSKWEKFDGNYVGIYEREPDNPAVGMLGLAAVGLWRRGDELNGFHQRMRHGIEVVTPQSRWPEGIHAFATTNEALTHAALSAVYNEVVSGDRSVRAAVLEGADDLRGAFIAHGGVELYKGKNRLTDTQAAVWQLPPRVENHRFAG